MTLATARATLLDHLDDDATRWSVAQQDRALGWALSMCQADYAAMGGDRFNTVLAATTSAAGVASMSSVRPLAVRGVALSAGGRIWQLEEMALEQRGLDDTVARTIQIRYVPEYTLPTTTTHPLVGIGATGANSWLGFDNWICARAATFAAIKDAEQRPELLQLEAQMRDSVLVMPKIPRAIPFPRKQGGYAQIVGYTYTQATQSVLLMRTGVWA